MQLRNIVLCATASTVLALTANAELIDDDDDLDGGFGGVVVQVGITIDDTEFDPIFISVDDKGGFDLEKPLTLEIEGAELTLQNVAGNVDPIQTLGIGVVDFGAPSSFSVAISVPLIPPIPGLATWSTAIFGSCTDGAADGCGASTFMTAGGLADFTVNGFATSVSTIGPAFSIPSPGGPYAGATAMGMFDCTPLGGCTSFETLLSFTGSGGGDAIAFTTRYEINPFTGRVPEPGSLLLIGMGLVAFAASRRRMH